MKVKGLVWLGTRTDQFEPMLAFCQNLMGLTPVFIEPGFAVLDMPNGDRFEIFGADSSYNTFLTHPAAGFLVDDIAAAALRWKPTASNSSNPLTRKNMAMHGVIFGHQMVSCTH